MTTINDAYRNALLADATYALDVDSDNAQKRGHKKGDRFIFNCIFS